MRGFIVLGQLLLFTGCGASAQQEIAAVIRASDTAWERLDFDDGCSWMTERARQRYMSDAINPGARTCGEAYQHHAVEPDPDAAHSYAAAVPIEPPRVTGIRVDGDIAVATYSNDDRTRLRKVDGRWLIDSFSLATVTQRPSRR